MKNIVLNYKKEDNMSKHIGIIACSYEGAALCYQIICREATKLTGFFYYPEITMHTQIPKKYDDFIDQDNWDGVAELMVDSVNKIASCGADFAICPDNTVHRVFENVKETVCQKLFDSKKLVMFGITI